MHAPIHFALMIGYVIVGIVLLSWGLLCAVTAERLEKEGLAFRTGFIICAMFTPLAGIAAARMLAPQRAARPLAPRSSPS
jgi:hypothetical protein